MKKTYKDLLRFLSFIDKFSQKHKEMFLALYIAFGDDLLFLFHTLRGERILFPTTRTYRKVSRLIKEDVFEVVDSTELLYDQFRNKVDFLKLKVGDEVIRHEMHYLVFKEPVKLGSVYFLLLKKAE